MTESELAADVYAWPRVLWAKVWDGFISVRPVVTPNEASIGQPITSYVLVISKEGEVYCETAPAAPGQPAKLWVKLADLRTDLNGRRVGTIGQRRDEHGMPFVVKVEAVDDGKGLFE